MRADTQVVRNGWQSKFLDTDPAQGDGLQMTPKKVQSPLPPRDNQVSKKTRDLRQISVSARQFTDNWMYNDSVSS